ncbi:MULTISPECIES: DUF805 domain-containing protein [unclassified Arcicella]|uniref:DUF805 domain-containing protein n=1 Tax=unclassified Arcicella TaxID=2644986 RepID=UPI002859F158|nr:MULTISPECIES: DUF805 domain-containing protein [unclassified Arcicella]MDR6564425.1 uncharacterized membrane protein YhaH (DUF805 family) [Arcicella sp. BE51]MDR6814284.1 uncharacterized membrane protein YhaH (DUF805 family) [Arcicella sp. BE140]MDR6825694.1 uncharacterized membrane protein YhaH (DUF805 family) [Arcicella sp. BE139]
MFQNPFSFEGRIRRKEYAISLFIYFTLFISFGIIDVFIGEENIFRLILRIVWIFLIWFKLAQSAKRSQDLGKAWWFLFMPFCDLWLLFKTSQYGNNKYGLNPKGLGNPEPENL